ncbi:LamB/YcsF family protein [Campylobacter sp. RM9333]|nr:LamB/YcsF family protein [Campylobacter sp. RM12637]MBZ7993412.1 LamB/YcsF family protein [Campylobacter sp. RM9333]
MQVRIDFNSDLAEGMQNDDEILALISSVNVCCGLHAGGYKEIYNTLIKAKEYNLRIGAHPSFNDRANFGRTNENLNKELLQALLAYQFGAIKQMCELVGVKLSYVKPHGALYNMACVDLDLAKNIAIEVAKLGKDIALMGLSNSCLISAANDVGINSISEVFADRRYTDDGLLVSRTKENALIENEDEAINQVLNMIKHSYVISENGKKINIKADSLCVHGDSKKALLFAQKIKKTLEENNISIRSN